MTPDPFAALPPVRQPLTLAGENLEITPLQIGELPVFARTLAPIARNIGPNPDWWALLSQDGDTVINALAIASRKPREWVAALSLDEGVSLAEAIFEANLNFFIQRVLPTLLGTSTRLQQLTSGIGAISSSASSGPATDTPTS